MDSGASSPGMAVPAKVSLLEIQLRSRANPLVRIPGVNGNCCGTPDLPWKLRKVFFWPVTDRCRRMSKMVAAPVVTATSTQL